MSKNPPQDHPPIDWTKWSPAGDGDVRSPCPMLNALANHSILPHTGKGITKAFAVTALTTSLNLSPSIANVFASIAVTANPDHAAHSFDLDHVNKHGLIEHDVSLSRGDVGLGKGDNHTFDGGAWGEVVREYGGVEETSFETASKVRYQRVVECKKAHEDAGTEFGYGIKEFILSYGESALFLGLLGDPKEGRIPVEYLRILFEEERVPFNEGWRMQERTVTQADMNHMIFRLIQANEYKAAEATEVGLGTVHAVENAVASFLPLFCTVM